MISIFLIPPLVFVFPFSKLAKILAGGRHTYRTEDFQPDGDTLAAWVDGALWRLPPPWRRTCLKRAAIIFFLLRSTGVKVVLRVGVKRNPQRELHAHAWLTDEDGPYLEPDLKSLEGLSTIAVFPEKI